MAFTDAQKIQIRFYLGYPFPFQQLNARLEGAIDLVGANAAASSMVNDMLVRLTAVYGLDPSNPGSAGQVDQAIAQAGVKSVESADDKIEFGTTASGGASASSAILATQMDLAKRLVSALSSMMGVEIANDVFGNKGYSNDMWKARSNQMSVGPRTVLMGG